MRLLKYALVAVFSAFVATTINLALTVPTIGQAVSGLVCGPVGVGCFVLRTVPGSAATPAMTSSLDTTTGDFFPAIGYNSSAAGGVEIQRMNATTVMQKETVAAVSGASGVTLTAAQVLGGIINRSGVGAGQTDSLDTTANLYAAMGSPPVGLSFTFQYVNTTANAVTLAGGDGSTTLVGNASLAATGAGVVARRVTCVVTAVTPTIVCYL